MTDTTNTETTETTAFATLEGQALAPIAGYTIEGDVVREAVANGVAALQGEAIGTYGIVVRKPAGYEIETFDERDFEDMPRHVDGNFEFVTVRSLAQYLTRYKTDRTIGYVTDITRLGARALVEDQRIADYVVDDHAAVGAEDRPGRRLHHARLVLRPTPEARRWGKALQAPSLDQEALLDLVIDGIGEIADPPGADLHDLIADLHAISTTSVRSVVRTGGNASIDLNENVRLRGGPGSTVEIPEVIRLTFAPYVGFDLKIDIKARLKPSVREGAVTFTLTAPQLETAMYEVVTDVAQALTQDTGLEPLWVP